MKFFINNYAYPGLCKALEDRGHTVLGRHGTNSDEFNWWHHMINNKMCEPDYHQLLQDQILEHKPDVYLCGKGWHFNRKINPKTVKWIRDRVGATIYWSLDDPDFMGMFEQKNMNLGYDIALTCDGASIKRYEALGMDSYLFWPAWDEVARDYIQVPEDKKDPEFLIVGTPYGKTKILRRDVAIAISNADIKLELWGPKDWPSMNGGHPSLRKHYKGYWKQWNTVHHLFAKAKMNFCNHLHVSKNYLNDRVPMVLGTGGFLFLDRQPGLQDWFVDQKHVVYYDDINDLVSKAKYYRDKPELRKEIGDNARQLILDGHTYKHRADFLLEILATKGIK